MSYQPEPQRCPCCHAEIKLALTRHSLERLDERIYLKYFRNFRMGESKEKWLVRVALEAIQKGEARRTPQPDIIMHWLHGVMFVFRKIEGTLLLLTVYTRSLPRKREVIHLPAGLDITEAAE